MNNELYYEESKGLNNYITKTMAKMALGLLVSTLVATYLLFSGLWVYFYTSGLTMLILAFVQLGVAFYLQSKINSITPNHALGLFLAYSALTGVTFSVLPLLFNVASIFIAFALTTLMFGSMAVIGKTTNVDLCKYSTLFTIGLVFLIISGFVSFFLNLGPLATGINFLGIIIFLGLTAYDIQRIKYYYEYYSDDEAMLSKSCTIAALQLYLDFVNIFLYVLRFVGRNDD